MIGNFLSKVVSFESNHYPPRRFSLVRGGQGESPRHDFDHQIIVPLRLQLHGAIYRPDSFVMMLRYCANLKAIRYESTSLNRIVANKSHRVIAA